jgi:ribosomal protein S18 acetylase RimI-like enzyme
MPAASWTISDATSADAAAILSLWSAAEIPAGVSDTPDGLAALLRTDSGALLIAVSEDRVVGSLIAAWDGWRGSFYRLAVHPDRRREGIGSALLREGERRLGERGALRLTAIVADDEPLAPDFWRAAGYEQQPNRVRFLRHLGSDAPTGRSAR